MVLYMILRPLCELIDILMEFEEKYRIIIELQKLDIEISMNNKRRKTSKKPRFVWDECE